MSSRATPAEPARRAPRLYLVTPRDAAGLADELAQALGAADVAAGHVAASIAEAGASLPLIKDGKLRALAVTSATRFPTLPDVPPLAEAVGVPDLEAVSWHVIFARHDTPRPIVNRLHDEMGRIMAAPEMREKVMAIGLIPYESPSVEGIQSYIKAETEKWGTLVRKLGLEGSQ